MKKLVCLVLALSASLLLSSGYLYASEEKKDSAESPTAEEYQIYSDILSEEMQRTAPNHAQPVKPVKFSQKDYEVYFRIKMREKEWDINGYDLSNMTPLARAFDGTFDFSYPESTGKEWYCPSEEYVGALIACGADVNKMTGVVARDSVLNRAFYPQNYSDRHDAQRWPKIKRLLDARADITATSQFRGQSGKTNALMRAAASGCLPAVEYMLSEYPDVVKTILDDKDGDFGDTALLRTTWKNSRNVDSDPEHTPAVRKHCSLIARKLLDAKADPSIPNKHGHTFLSSAEEWSPALAQLVQEKQPQLQDNQPAG